MSEPVSESGMIQVRMLGDFSITRGSHRLSQSSGRTKRAWLLLEYLLAHRTHEVSVDQLIDMLWGDDECSDPLNALKNLVYRARELLRNAFEDSKTSYILYTHGTYRWNPDLPCTVDIETLETSCNKAHIPNLEPSKRILLLQQAIAVYQGDFLPNSCYADWVVTMGTHFTSLYTQAVSDLCNEFEKQQQYADIISLCEKAVTQIPFEESIQRILFDAYITMGQNQKALKHYNYITGLFYRELGVDISGSFRDLYKKILKSINRVELDISVIKNDLREAADDGGPGAYYCDYEIFRNLYRIQARSLMRTGQSIYIALMTLIQADGSIPESAPTACNSLKDSILCSLRRGDVVSQYSSTQFIIMLPLINFENTEMVMLRIIRNFEKAYKKKDIKIIYKFNPIDAVED